MYKVHFLIEGYGLYLSFLRSTEMLYICVDMSTSITMSFYFILRVRWFSLRYIFRF